MRDDQADAADAARAAGLQALAAGQARILVRHLVADLETPVGAFAKLTRGSPYAFLLESVEGGERLGRYSFIGLAPDLLWRCRDGLAEVSHLEGGPADGPEGAAAGGHWTPEPDGPLASLRRQLAAAAATPDDALLARLPPMRAGLAGYLGYDMVRLMEHLPARLSADLDVPDALLLRPTVICAFDNLAQTATLMLTVRPRAGVPPETLWTAAEARMQDLIARLSAPLDPAVTPALGPVVRPRPLDLDALAAASNTGRAAYCQMVESARGFIAAGDIFQVVLGHRLSLPLDQAPFEVYRRLRRLNPSPFLFYFDFGDHQVVGSSPEILVRVREGEVTIRPLAGTRPRGATPEADAALAAELLADPKERAEHLMLLDLGRNDVGRVATLGSVTVTEQFAIERYSHVMHISSTVTGRLDRDRADALDALIAGFPAGTVSGAPKIRAMEIIEALEIARRQIYGGAVGYLSADGNLDTCIALRTAVIKDGVIHIQAGAGVVHDSVPEAEWQETLRKAAALVAAAQG